MSSQHKPSQKLQDDKYSKTDSAAKAPASQPKARNADVHAEPKNELRQKVNAKNPAKN